MLQQCNNVGFVRFDGQINGGLPVSARRRMRGMHDNNTRHKISNKNKSLNINAHSSAAFTSASASISSWHTSVRPQRAAKCIAVNLPRLQQKVRRKFHQDNTIDSATKVKDGCAPICRIHVTFGGKQQLARLCLTFASSFM